MAGGSRTRIVAALALVVATLVVLGGRADAASGPTFTGGKQLAAYTGNGPSSLSHGSEQRTLAVWQQEVGSQHDIYGATIAEDATQANPSFKIATGSTEQTAPDVAWNGSDWLVVWQVAKTSTNHDIKGQLFAVDGDPLGSTLSIATTSGDQTAPAIASGSNGQFLVVWQETRNGSTGDVYGRRVQGSGQLLGAAAIRMSFDTSGAPTDDGEPDVAWNGSSYLIVWASFGADQQYAILADHRRADGTRIARGLLLGSDAPIDAPAIASDGHRFLTVFGAGDDILGVSGVGPEGDTDFVRVTEDIDGPKTDAAITFNGDYLIAWKDSRNGDQEIWGARVAGTKVVDPNGFLITDFYPVNGAPALTVGGASPQTYGFSWDPTPSGQQSGVVAYGMQFATK